MDDHNKTAQSCIAFGSSEEYKTTMKDLKNRGGPRKVHIVESSKRSLAEGMIKLRADKTQTKRSSRRNVNVETPRSAHEISLVISQCQVAFGQWQSNPSHLEMACNTVQQVRELLTVKQNPPNQQVLDADLLRFFYRGLQCDESPKMQFECAWSLTNIASSPDVKVTKQVAEFPGMVHELGRLLVEGKTVAVRRQCAWCIGNIAGDSSDYRDGLLKMDNVRDGFTHNIIHPETDKLLGTFVWALSSILKDSSRREVIETRCFTRPLIRTLDASSVKDVQLRVDLCYCLQYLAEEGVEHGARTQEVINSKALPVLMKVLKEELEQKEKRPNVLVPLMRCFGMLAAGTAEQTNALLDAGVLDYVPRLMKLANSRVTKEVLWTLSNIAAGTHEQASALSARPRIIKYIVDSTMREPWPARREGLWTLCNLLTSEHRHCYIENLEIAGASLALSANLNTTEFDLLCMILDGIDNLLAHDKTSPGGGNLPVVLDEIEAIDQIESLLKHRSDTVYQKARRIIEEYFGTEPDMVDEEDQYLCPEEGDNAAFTFGFAPTAKQLFPDIQPVYNFECANPGSA